MGYAPDLWGPSTWDTIHLLCYTAPESLNATEQLQFVAFFKALPYVLPCATCSQHLLSHYETNPVENAVATRQSLFAWSVQIHNAVNEMLGKPTMTVEEATRRWRTKMGGVSSATAPDVMFFQSPIYRWVFIALVLLALVLAIFLIMRMRKKRS